MILMTLVIVLFAALMGMTLISCENDEKTDADEGDHYRMALSILHNINPNYAYTCDIGDLFYWDVYPKRESKPIIVERNVEKKVVNIM